MTEETTATGQAIDEQEAFDGFYHREHVRLFRYLVLLTASPEEAEDLGHEAFVRVLERWDRVGRMEDPRGYLYRTAMNLHKNVLRRTSRRIRRSVVERGIEPDFSAAAVDRTAVIRAIRALPRPQLEAVLLTDLIGFTSEEAAGVLGIRADAVRGRVRRAREAMRGELADDG